MRFDLEGAELMYPRYSSISSLDYWFIGKKRDVLLIYTSLNDILSFINLLLNNIVFAF